MRIVFLVHRYWPLVGGVEKYIHELAKSLLSMGHEIDVVAGAVNPGLPPQDVHDGIRIHRFPALRSPLRSRWWFIRNLAILRQADVIHVSNTHMLEYLWRMLGPLVDRRKVFLTRHGLSYIHPVPDSEKRRARRSVDLAAGVVHDGEFIGKWLGLQPDLCPDQGLSPTADEIQFTPEPLPNSATYVGRLEADSGIAIYMDGVRRLTRDLQRIFELHVYGDGSLAGELKAEAARDSLPVHFHGRQPDAQRHIADTCFAFIDGRMAIQEAMARKRLVFAAYVDPLKRDYVGIEPFSPYLVAIGSGGELAHRVCHYMDHPGERRKLVNSAYEHARTLSWRRTAEAYVRFWQERLAQQCLSLTGWQASRIAWILEREAGRPKDTWAQETPVWRDLTAIPAT